ncbi:MAG: 30S ribosomal protein S11 [Patescibacteria group bacterium]|nr:30S ribosomal protein S11 [Patescibacteria group bacterium]
MGKKKITKKTREELIKESEAVESALTRKRGQTIKQKHENGRIYIRASYNNTFITVTDSKGNVVTWMTAGSLGFSGPKKSTPFAASKVAGAIMEKIQRSGPFNVDILVRGVGGGRDSAVRSLAAKGLNILSIKDVTPIPHNGPRRRKARRV